MRVEDAWAFLEVHHAVVRELAAKENSQEVIDHVRLVREYLNFRSIDYFRGDSTRLVTQARADLVANHSTSQDSVNPAAIASASSFAVL